MMQDSRNAYIYIKQNIFAVKALFYIQQLYIYAASRNCIHSTSRKWYTTIYLIAVNEIWNSFKGHIFIHKKYNQSSQFYSFTELYSSKGTYRFIQGNISSFKENIFIRGNYIHSRKYIYLRNIYSFKFKAICSFKETIFIEHCCVRGNSRNIYSKIVPSPFTIIISFAITIAWIKYSYNYFRLKDEEIADMIEGSVL